MSVNSNYGLLEETISLSDTEDQQNDELISSVLKFQDFEKTHLIKATEGILNDQLSPLVFPDFNWSLKLKNWSVLDQESSQMCVGFAVGAGLLTFFLNKSLKDPTIKLRDKNKIDASLFISPRFSYAIAKLSLLDGQAIDYFSFIISDYEPTKVLASLKAHIAMGYCNSSTLPFDLSKAGFDKMSILKNELILLKRSFSKYKIVYFLRTRKSSQAVWSKQFERAKKWVEQVGPVLVNIRTDEQWRNADKSSSYLVEFDSKTEKIKHSVLWVGFRYRNGQEFIILRNSFGKTWGDEGHAYVSKDYLKSCMSLSLSVLMPSYSIENINRDQCVKWMNLNNSLGVTIGPCPLSVVQSKSYTPIISQEEIPPYSHFEYKIILIQSSNSQAEQIHSIDLNLPYRKISISLKIECLDHSGNTIWQIKTNTSNT